LNLGVFPSGQWGQTVNLLLFSFGGSNPPAPTKKSFSVTTTLELFVLYVHETHECGRIRTASARRTVRREKSPSGAFLDARLATSTRAHQKIQYPNRVLDLLFCGNFFRAGREEGKCEKQSPVLAQARRVC
jgi:hypothetical protein